MQTFEDANRIPVTPNPRNNSWVSENIWGHRIERQPCKLLLLEFLAMAEGMHRKGNLLNPAHTTEFLCYQPYLSTQLRNILFKNPLIGEIRLEHGDSETAWTEWFASMKGTVSNDPSLVDLTYIRERFPSFNDFASVVDLLSRITIPEIGAKQWNNMRLHPIGPAAFYDERNKDFNSAHTQFTRTGELAYLMLARSSRFKKEITNALEEAFDPSSSKNRLLCSLMKNGAPDLADGKSGTHLPYKQHPSFDLLAEDVRALYRLQMPTSDTYQHLAPMLALHVMLYQLRTAAMLINKDAQPPPIVCEILAPKNTQVRRASVDSISENESIPVQALDQYCRNAEAQCQEIQRILSDDDPSEQSTIAAFREEMIKLFSINKSKFLTVTQSIDEVRNSIFEFIHNDYKEAAGDGLRSMSDEAGLRSNVKTRQHRYCPSDQFLRNMVYANVTSPIKETTFLAKLYERYGIVIGPEEAQLPGVVRRGLFQSNEFKNNKERLMNRLIAMGLARRMSDSFTYVRNPIALQQDV